MLYIINHNFVLQQAVSLRTLTTEARVRCLVKSFDIFCRQSGSYSTLGFPCQYHAPMLRLIFIYIPSLQGIKIGQGCELKEKQYIFLEVLSTRILSLSP
jgi:hypothetical protein